MHAVNYEGLDYLSYEQPDSFNYRFYQIVVHRFPRHINPSRSHAPLRVQISSWDTFWIFHPFEFKLAHYYYPVMRGRDNGQFGLWCRIDQKGRFRVRFRKLSRPNYIWLNLHLNSPLLAHINYHLFYSCRLYICVLCEQIILFYEQFGFDYCGWVTRILLTFIVKQNLCQVIII